jgi:hypothetical protein
MQSFGGSMKEYKLQMEKGTIPAAYRGLMEYLLALRNHFKNKYAEYAVPGSIYYGYMDMTYFSIVPAALKERQLKIAVVFIHETCRFEVWLAGTNKQVQAEYWKQIKESGWSKYRLVPTTRGADSILEHTLADDPDFGALGALTARIEAGVVEFIREVEGFLAKMTGDR